MTDETWIKAERAHEYRMAEIASNERKQRRRQMTERVTAITVGVAICVIVATLCLLLWRVMATNAENNTQRDKDCVASGGTRAQFEGGPVMCLHLDGRGEPS